MHIYIYIYICVDVFVPTCGLRLRGADCEYAGSQGAGLGLRAGFFFAAHEI